MYYNLIQTTMSRKPNKNSFSVKIKNNKSKIRTEKIQNVVSIYSKTNQKLNFKELEDTIDEID